MSVSRNAEGQVVVTRQGFTASDIPVTATATRVNDAYGFTAWDFVAIDAMGRYVAFDMLRSYNAVCKAFEVIGV